MQYLPQWALEIFNIINTLIITELMFTIFRLAKQQKQIIDILTRLSELHAKGIHQELKRLREDLAQPPAE